jgi:hypothetical protein
MGPDSGTEFPLLIAPRPLSTEGTGSDLVRAQTAEPRAPEKPLAARAATPNSPKIEIPVTYLEQTSGPIRSETISEGGSHE